MTHGNCPPSTDLYAKALGGDVLLGSRRPSRSKNFTHIGIAQKDAARLLHRHLSEGALVLDVGCGTGLFGDELKALGRYSVIGLDTSAKASAAECMNADYDGFICHRLQDLPLPIEKDAMSAAACVGVLSYVDEPGHLLREICRCVEPGGFVTFTERTDTWGPRRFEQILTQLASENLWTILEITGAWDYLPDPDKDGDDIKVFHTVCQLR